MDCKNWQLETLQSSNLTVGIERYERITSYFGIETRHPLLDIRLLQFSCAVPMRQKVRDGWSKYLLRGLAAQRLPQSVAWREGWEGPGLAVYQPRGTAVCQSFGVADAGA